MARKGNKYLQDKQPWIVAKDTNDNGQPTSEAQASIDNCLHICLQLCANLAVFVNPFLPFTAKKLIHMMKVVDKMLDWENAGKIKLLSVGYSLRQPQKIEDEEINLQIQKLKSGLVNSLNTLQATVDHNKEESKMETIKPGIVFDDFAKIDLRTGTIVSAEKVDKADKLLKLEIDLGFEKRTIVSGIALHFKSEEIINKQVVVVANLAPRKMRGIESNGMILLAEDKEGKLYFVAPDKKIDNGSGVS